MTRREALAIWRDQFMPDIRAQEARRGVARDIPLRCETWNNWIDALAEEGTITQRQADAWTHPATNTEQ